MLGRHGSYAVRRRAAVVWIVWALLPGCVGDGAGSGATGEAGTTGGGGASGDSTAGGSSGPGTGGGPPACEPSDLGPCAADEADPADDAPDGPGVPVVGHGTRLSRSLCAADPADRFVLNLDGPAYVAIDTVVPVTPSGRPHDGRHVLLLRSASGRTIGRSATGPAGTTPIRAIHRLLSAGTYRIEVVHEDPNTPADERAYELRVDVFPAQP